MLNLGSLDLPPVHVSLPLRPEIRYPFHMMRTLFDMEPPSEGALNLNPAQWRAITHGEGPLLVIAGAGTGKTRVITERIRHLLQSDATLSGENILALTFTKKAAGEMKSRVVKVGGERGKDVTMATFHSFCETLLKEVQPGRTALEQVDHWILLRRNMARLKLEKYRRLAEPGQFLGDFIAFFSRCQDELVSSSDYQTYADDLAAQLQAQRSVLDQDIYKERAENVALQQEIARAYKASEELLREKNAVALNGLIAETVALLQGDHELRARLQQRYRHILVDEFQDTNIAQLELLHLLSAAPRNIVVVGDNDQAIYRFRGASFGSFKLFLERFAAWKAGQDSTRFRVTLTENYRSTPNILRVATQVIAQNEVSADFPNKVLSPTRPEGERIRIVELNSPEDEARWVTSELERLHGAGNPWRDFAVLYRQHAHRDHLVEELSRRKIPFVITRLSILEHPLVRDVLAYLRLIATPYNDIACARVLAAPAWNLQAEDLVRFAQRARKKRGTSLYDALQSPQSDLPFDPSPMALSELFEFVSTHRRTLRRRTAREILSDLIEWVEIPQLAGVRDRRYITQLAQFLKDWEPKSESRLLPEFLEYLDYFEQAGGAVCLEDDAPGDAVQLMTVHGAKGLEFPHVFLLRVNQGAFPPRPRPPLFEFPLKLMKEELPAGDFHIQEERRLCYVALTRAERKLTITTLTEKKGKIPTFIEDILMEPAVRRRDVLQIAPKIRPREDDAGIREGAARVLSLFPVPAPRPRIFSKIAEWAETFHPPSPEPLKLSASAVDNYRKCPQQYLFGYLWSLKEGPRATLSFGSVMHTTIRRFVEQLRRGVKLPFEEVARIFETEWTSAGFEDDYQEGEYKKDGIEQLRVFHAAVLEAQAKIRDQEKAFELPLENNVIVSGRIDQINSLGRNDVEIVDYKTGKPRNDADARRDLQLSIYALAAKEIFELNPVRLTFHYLQNNQIQVTARDPKQLDEAQKIVQEAAADIRAGEFSPKPGFACRDCAYEPICPAHEEALSA
jgi:DNA helicase-2/ATP-dependent DNA helicase PcrA